MILDDLANLLIANGMTAVYKATLPDGPDEAICLYEYGGFAQQKLHDGVAWRNPSIQALVRSKQYQTARTTIETVYSLLGGLINQQVGASRILKATPVQEPFPLGPVDNQGRVRLICNFDISVTA